MTKTIAMVLALAAVLALGTACSGLFSPKAPAAETQVEACAGLGGQAKTDCEKRLGH